MAKFVEFMGRSTGVVIDADTLIGTYTPSISGRLKKIIVVPGGIAATSLIENGHVKLTCKSFGGVEMFAPFQGVGLETVPRYQKVPCVTECDLAVQGGIPISLYYYYNVLPVTPELVIFGEFEG